MVCHIAAQLPATDRWRLRCCSKKVRQMILDHVPRPWPFMTDFTGRRIRFFGRAAPHWMRLIHRLPAVYRPDQFRDPAACVAVYCGPENSWLECRRGDVVEPTDYYYDDIPFIRDEFMDVMRERIYFGFLDSLYGWLDQCHVRMDNDGFFNGVENYYGTPRKSRSVGGRIFAKKNISYYVVFW